MCVPIIVAVGGKRQKPEEGRAACLPLAAWRTPAAVVGIVGGLIMQRPKCQQPMTRGKKTWICEDCDVKHPFKEAGVPQPSTLPGLDALPNVLAAPLHGYTTETSPVLQLHRLCDA